MTTKCLSCNIISEGKFCSNCSQSLSTHRFSFQHVLQHDFIHGVFHFDKGFFYTIKELFTRPGHSTREYIQGKRTKHFNYFTTVIIVMTIGYFIKKWSQLDLVMLSEDKKHIEFHVRNLGLYYLMNGKNLSLQYLAECPFVYYYPTYIHL